MEIQFLKNQLLMLLMHKIFLYHKASGFLVTQHRHRHINTNLYFGYLVQLSLDFIAIFFCLFKYTVKTAKPSMKIKLYTLFID